MTPTALAVLPGNTEACSDYRASTLSVPHGRARQRSQSLWNERIDRAQFRHCQSYCKAPLTGLIKCLLDALGNPYNGESLELGHQQQFIAFGFIKFHRIHGLLNKPLQFGLDHFSHDLGLKRLNCRRDLLLPENGSAKAFEPLV